MMSIPDSNNKESVCAWCARKLSGKELGEYEVNWHYQGKRDMTKGYYICIVCKNWMENLIQTKTTHTYMVIKARAERPCCGGGGGG